MSTQQRLLRLAPNAASSLNARTGVRGEIFYDNEHQSLRIYDGTLKGGRELLLNDFSNVKPGSVPPTAIADGYMTFGHTVVGLGGSTNSLVGLEQVQAFSIIGNTSGTHYGDVIGSLVTTDAMIFGGASIVGVTGTGGLVLDHDAVINFPAISNATSMSFTSGATVTEFSVDNTLSDNSTSAVPTESAVKSYVDAQHFYVGTTDISISRASATQTLTGVSIDGNAATVSNGVYTNQTYSNPSWITSLALSKVGFTASNSFTYNAAAATALSIKKTSTTLEFGTQPVSSKSFTISDANIQATNAVTIIPLGSDEWEMDPIMYSAQAYDGGVTIFASTSQGPVKGPRTVYYTLA